MASHIARSIAGDGPRARVRPRAVNDGKENTDVKLHNDGCHGYYCCFVT